MAATAQANISDTRRKDIPAFASGMKDAGDRLGSKFPEGQGEVQPANAEQCAEAETGTLTSTTLLTAQSPSQHRQTRRARILVDATREFSRLSRPSSEDIARYKELFYELAGHVPASDRRLVSAILARLAFTPRAIAIYLAQDEIEIAAPFLLFSPVLGERDLAAISTKMGMRYRDIIARRNASRAAASPEMSSEANDDVDLIETGKSTFLLHRDPLDPYGPQAQTGSSSLAGASQMEPAPLSGEEIMALASAGGKLGRRGRPSQAAPDSRGGVIPAQREGSDGAPFAGVSLTETRKLLHFARTGNADGFAALVEEACGLEHAATVRLLRARGGVEILYLIRALGVPSPHDLQMMLLVQPETGRSLQAYKEAKSLLGELDQGICRMIFNEIGARFVIPGRVESLSGQATGETRSSASGRDGFAKAIRERRAALAHPQARRSQDDWNAAGREAS